MTLFQSYEYEPLPSLLRWAAQHSSTIATAGPKFPSPWPYTLMLYAMFLKSPLMQRHCHTTGDTEWPS
jgi:hypothetical protein